MNLNLDINQMSLSPRSCNSQWFNSNRNDVEELRALIEVLSEDRIRLKFQIENLTKQNNEYCEEIIKAYNKAKKFEEKCERIEKEKNEILEDRDKKDSVLNTLKKIIDNEQGNHRHNSINDQRPRRIRPIVTLTPK